MFEPGRAVELFGQFEVVAVVDDSPDHGVAGIDERASAASAGLVEALTPDCAKNGADRSSRGNCPLERISGGQSVVNLCHVAGGQDPRMTSQHRVAGVAVVDIPGVAAGQGTEALLLVGLVDRVEGEAPSSHWERSWATVASTLVSVQATPP